MHLSKYLFIALTLTLSPLSFGQDGEIVVTGRRVNSTLGAGIGIGYNIFGNDLLSQMQEFDSGYSEDNYEVGTSCSAATDKLNEEIVVVGNKLPKVILIGEAHETFTANEIKDFIQRLVPNTSGACFGLEIDSLSSNSINSLANPTHTQQIIDMARNDLNMRVFAIDGATVPDDESVSTINKRDTFMASAIFGLQSSCSQIITLNGINHVVKSYDPRDGRKNLTENLAQFGVQAETVNTEEASHECGIDNSVGGTY